MYYATLRDMILYLHKDENGFKQDGLYESPGDVLRIHHSLAVLAPDYGKKQHVFRLQTADWAQYLFQTRFRYFIIYHSCMLYLHPSNLLL